MAYTFRKGFTLVELLLLFGILILLIIGSLPLAINFYKTRQLGIHENGIVQALRRAQLKAMSVENNSSFGVYISLNQYVLFKGNSYASRDPTFDESFDLPDIISVSGLSEIVFSKLKGIPSNTGTISLTINAQTEHIEINEVGRVNY